MACKSRRGITVRSGKGLAGAIEPRETPCGHKDAGLGEQGRRIAFHQSLLLQDGFKFQTLQNGRTVNFRIYVSHSFPWESDGEIIKNREHTLLFSY